MTGIINMLMKIQFRTPQGPRVPGRGPGSPGSWAGVPGSHGVPGARVPIWGPTWLYSHGFPLVYIYICIILFYSSIFYMLVMMLPCGG